MVASYKYLGHYITDDHSDDDDINRQRRTLFVQGNIIPRNVFLGCETHSFVLIVHLCIQLNCGGITKIYHYENYKLLIITFSWHVKKI